MGKAQAVLDLFPSPYTIRDPRKLLKSVVGNLAQPADEADSHLFRIQRAHRLEVAEHADDIMRLAALLNLSRQHFADLLDDEDLEYDEKLRLMRLRVRRVAGLHLEGTGTPWAAVEGASIFLDAINVRATDAVSRLHRGGTDGYSRYAAIESDRGGETHRGRIYLHENPRRRHKIEPVARWPLLDWPLQNESVEKAQVRIAIQGVGDRTVRPAVVCPDSGQGVLFDGIVPDGSALVIDAAGARVDGIAVDEWITFFEGGIHSYTDFTRTTAVTQTAATATRPFDAERRAVPSLPVHTARPVPDAPVGTSRWFLQVDEGVFGGSTFDYSVFDTPHAPIGFFDEDPAFEEAVFWYPPSAVTGMAWDERIPCAFKLSLPRGFGSLPAEEWLDDAWELGETVLGDTPLGRDSGSKFDRAVAGRVSRLLPRFRAAGVRSFVEPAKPSWTLGDGILRTRYARWGRGVTTDDTTLADPYGDTLIRV